MSDPGFTLRRYTAVDEDAAIELWRRSWQQHYPHINFTERVAWWRERWRWELVPPARVVIAEVDGTMIGFVTVDPQTCYLDQIVVAPEHWGAGVALGTARRGQASSPHGLDLLVNKDNARAIRFYEKHGFAYVGEDKNPVSGKPVNKMIWRPQRTGPGRRRARTSRLRDRLTAPRPATAPSPRRRVLNPP